ncbi:hypothetical protein [Dubosiella newyorkensis]|jgi:chemotaxis regulatin CheY-phosphate phosphatase CheZ|uniref:DNA repair protein n=1 Tax=Dubosiella newyorkensis TaxID=1862672 RepID=A0A1U7NQF8_9FIRM|nr:hypothetical protein [Dubosiella newyorkensis]OLU47869.1 hypothetical protein BO225_00920 [Dubosiella newyorkensis]
MTEKELKKLSRLELLELLVERTREVESLKAQLEEANRKLEDRTIVMNESGNIAEAALRLNHIFEECQRAADEYLESVKKSAEHEQKEGD